MRETPQNIFGQRFLTNLDHNFLKSSKESEVSKNTDKLRSRQPSFPKCSAEVLGFYAALAISSLILTDPNEGALCSCVSRSQAGLEERAEGQQGPSEAIATGATGTPTQGIILHSLCFPHRRSLAICCNYFLIEKSLLACHVPSLCLIGKSHLISMPNSISSASGWIPRVLLSELRGTARNTNGRDRATGGSQQKGKHKETFWRAGGGQQAAWEAWNKGKSSAW